MIEKLYVDNFKSLNEFEITLSPFTVIVGNNTAGKSSVLQVIEFLMNTVREDFNVILERRGWTVGDVKSKLCSKSRICIQCDIGFPNGESYRKISWELVISAYINKNIMELSSEKIILHEQNEEKELLVYNTSSAADCCLYDAAGEKHPIEGISEIHSSFLKMISISDENKSKYPILTALKEYLLDSDSFELLSPEKMRLSSRGVVDSIGNAGEKLPSFIKSMTEIQKNNFNKNIAEIFGDTVVSVDAKTKGTPGWTQIISTERYLKKTMPIESKNMSDGILRMLAFLAVAETDKQGVTMLFDEIENGINLNYAEKLIHVLKTSCQSKGNQLIVTTHSAIFMDYVDMEEIIYLFRDPETGFTRAEALFDRPVFRKKLEYLYPGEVFMNISNEEIVKMLLETEGTDK